MLCSRWHASLTIIARLKIQPSDLDHPIRKWIAAFGARELILDAAEHDRLVAWSSHLPQLASTALAAVLNDHAPDAAKVAGPGRGRNADVAALRLAARGFTCRRLRGALLRAFNISEVGQPEVLLDFSTEESTDVAFEQLEEIAEGMAASIEQIPLPMRRVVEKLRRNVYQGASEMGESGQDIFRSAIVNFLCPLLGGEIYDGRPIAAMFGVDPAEVEPEAGEFVNQRWLLRLRGLNS